MRALATVRKITRVIPHPNADLLDLAIVDGWQCVVKKGEHRSEELIVYCEIDSVLPVKEKFEFLRKGCYVNRDWIEGFRIKTIRLRQEMSQGLVLPLNVLGDAITADGDNQFIVEGADVTEHLGIKKWEPPVAAHLAGQQRGNFPSWIQKTDEERIQNIHNRLVRNGVFDAVKWTAEEKMDGSSMTVAFRKGTGDDEDDVHVCSRNISLKLEDIENSFVKMAFASNAVSALTSMGRNLAIQGELCGPGIQGNKYRLSEMKWFIFYVFDVDTQKYLDPQETTLVLNTLQNDYGFVADRVPRLTELSGKLDANDDLGMQCILKAADGMSKVTQETLREGVVFKGVFNGELITFKAISNQWLLEYKE